eukprot:TRINITY_DN1146_c0_g1_i1.p1 TRINITY_DN1146_c0_g1~~TRINITY_DN1146_c0_g1_i1.p1  ORF type:complete len:166 (+),score=25.81 TRINITY_DN1146_c0_g1_i1:513-1010(+)
MAKIACKLSFLLLLLLLVLLRTAEAKDPKADSKEAVERANEVEWGEFEKVETALEDANENRLQKKALQAASASWSVVKRVVSWSAQKLGRTAASASKEAAGTVKDAAAKGYEEGKKAATKATKNVVEKTGEAATKATKNVVEKTGEAAEKTGEKIKQSVGGTEEL